ncbi:hypothetical protein AG1IA_09678 [Rhizoctonia solani AG-1 IA]|uniref:Uncharacterized protein n=1 Tax=Thanatephorus cucumeris (strain AG1-IA) TaxID=983506 RepID=L8WHV8_THACA|nr:hypothetical protein AG1IA_09678 [Rhizoctonia solani AG-1 IA]
MRMISPDQGIITAQESAVLGATRRAAIPTFISPCQFQATRLDRYRLYFHVE